MYVLDRADVKAAGRLNGDDKGLVAVNLAGDDGFLLVAAGVFSTVEITGLLCSVRHARLTDR